MNTACKYISASVAATVAAVMLAAAVVTGSAHAQSEGAAQEQYPASGNDGQTTTSAPAEVPLPQGTAPADAATVVQYYPVAPDETVVRYIKTPTPAAAGTGSPTETASPLTASTTPSKVFMLLGSGAALSSIIASGMAIIRGKK